MGAIFGVATVVGPLLGGFIVENSSWRWIFYVNLPLGLAALAVITVAFAAPVDRVKHRIDYLGATLLAGGLSAIVLYTTLGGTEYPWASTFMLALVAAGVVLLAAFVLVERRAAEPILPMRLFRNRVFSVCSAIGFLVGAGLFGAVTFLPLYLQTVRGHSPTRSGLLMTPMMAGMLITSIGSGQAISRFGRYKPFPIAGTAIMAVGFVLLSRLEVDTSAVVSGAYMLVLGLGLGLVMQVLVLAVQNAVDYSDLGVATSGITMFRQMGGAIGTAAFGATFNHQLAATSRAACRLEPSSPSRPTRRRSVARAGGASGLPSRGHGRARAGLPHRGRLGAPLVRAHVAAARGAAAGYHAGARLRRGLRGRQRRRPVPPDRTCAVPARQP